MKRSRWNWKTKNWKDNNSRRISKQKSKIRRNLHRHRAYELSVSREYDTFVVDVPRNFSLIDNTEETMAFFMGFIELIQKGKYKTKFYINSHDVENVTVDALIYLIAILQNDCVNIRMQYSYSGNFPLNAKAKKVYQESGFTSYVEAKIKELPRNTDKMKIVCGTKNNAEVSKQFCEFVTSKLEKQRCEVMSLYVVFIELMSNVYHHAYGNNDFMARQWYIYAEHVDNHIQFVFVDTGMGIAKTVRKNFGEVIQGMLGIGAHDGDLLRSTFNGDFRTQTSEKYRGNGLATVKQKVTEGTFRNFRVISGRGRCEIGSQLDKAEGTVTSENYKNGIYGTLYAFDFY